jgi:LmbE family N-acetylglucosaminyl deacetylase
LRKKELDRRIENRRGKHVTRRMRRAGGAIAALFGVLLLYTAIKAGHERLSAYRYDVRQDANYDFTRARPTRVRARMKGGHLDVPARLRSQNTVLLELRLDSTLLGRWFEPHVDIESTAGHFTQAFERGGSGLRYINLSTLDLSSPASIQMRGKYLQIRDQDVTLDYLPSDLDIEHQRILVISPHPDDAEIAAYGLYEGRDAYVVTVTAGDAGDPGIFSMFAGGEASLQKGRIRAWNSLVVPMLGGISADRTANLGYFDGTLATMKANPTLPVHARESRLDSLDAYRRAQSSDLISPRPDTQATWLNLVQDFEYLIKHVEPDIIVTPYPRLDEHPDHQLSTIALIQAIKNLHWMRGTLLLYSNHSPASHRYPYGDAGDLVSLPPATGVSFDGIWSQTLSVEKQARKYLALDAMVDIRPDLRPASLRSVASLFKHALTSSITDGDESYYRRAVRANELFFVLRVPSLYEPGIME